MLPGIKVVVPGAKFNELALAFVSTVGSHDAALRFFETDAGDGAVRCDFEGAAMKEAHSFKCRTLRKAVRNSLSIDLAAVSLLMFENNISSTSLLARRAAASPKQKS